MEMPAKCKLTGDGKVLWEMMVDDLGTILRNRHKAALFAMCQQWDLYQKSLVKLKKNKEPKLEWTLHCQMSSSLKMFSMLAKNFRIGINDQLQFNADGDIGLAAKKKAETRLGKLLSGGSLN